MGTLDRFCVYTQAVLSISTHMPTPLYVRLMTCWKVLSGGQKLPVIIFRSEGPYAVNLNMKESTPKKNFNPGFPDW